MRIEPKLFILIIFFNLCLKGFGFDYPKYAPKNYFLIDSLELSQLSSEDSLILTKSLEKYHSSKEDTNRIGALNSICENLIHDSWVSYLKFQYELINKALTKQKSDDEKRILKGYKASALANYGFVYDELGRDSLALDFYNKSLEMQKELGNKEGMATCYNNMGLIHKERGEIVIALDLYQNAMQLYKDVDDTEGLAYLYNNIGAIHSNQKDFKLAQEYYTKALELHQQLGNKDQMATALNNLGLLHRNFKHYDEGLTYFLKAKKIQKEINDYMGLSYSYNNISLIYSQNKQYDSALVYLNKTLKIQQKFKDIEGLAVTYKNIAQLKATLGELDGERGAEQIALKSFELANKLGYPENIKATSLLLADIYAAQAKSNNKSSAQKVHYSLNSLEMYKLYEQMKDSLNSVNALKATAYQHASFEYEKKKELNDLNHRKEMEKQSALAQAAEQKRNIIIVAISLGLVLVILFLLFVFNRLKITREQKLLIQEANEELNQTNEEILAQRDQIEEQRVSLQHQNDQIAASINYAKRIQDAIMPSMVAMNEALRDGFVLYLPKDIVAGDFFWMEKIGEEVYYAAADCTGHGVPGAMVSVVCSNALTKSLLEEKITNTGQILNRTRDLVIENLARSGEEVKDGMDISFCKLNIKTKQLQWSGANNPIWILRKESEEFEIIKANKRPIGLHPKPEDFTAHSIKLEEGDLVYIFTDGYQDQFGGPDKNKYMAKRLKNTLIGIRNLSMEKQKEELISEFNSWKGTQEQIDDVCVIGIRI